MRNEVGFVVWEGGEERRRTSTRTKKLIVATTRMKIAVTKQGARYGFQISCQCNVTVSNAGRHTHCGKITLLVAFRLGSCDGARDPPIREPIKAPKPHMTLYHAKAGQLVSASLRGVLSERQTSGLVGLICDLSHDTRRDAEGRRNG